MAAATIRDGATMTQLLRRMKGRGFGRASVQPFPPGGFSFRRDNIPTHIAAIGSGPGIGVTHQELAACGRELDQVLPEIGLPSRELRAACHSQVRHSNRINLTLGFPGAAFRRPNGSLMPRRLTSSEAWWHSVPARPSGDLPACYSVSLRN